MGLKSSLGEPQRIDFIEDAVFPLKRTVFCWKIQLYEFNHLSSYAVVFKFCQQCVVIHCIKGFS